MPWGPLGTLRHYRCHGDPLWLYHCHRSPNCSFITAMGGALYGSIAFNGHGGHLWFFIVIGAHTFLTSGPKFLSASVPLIQCLELYLSSMFVCCFGFFRGGCWLLIFYYWFSFLPFLPIFRFPFCFLCFFPYTPPCLFHLRIPSVL